jgi:DNA replication protein DnaC
MGHLDLRPEQANIFFKLMEERYRQRATIITTKLDYSEWPTSWSSLGRGHGKHTDLLCQLAIRRSRTGTASSRADSRHRERRNRGIVNAETAAS